MEKRLYRSNSSNVIGGVCGGLGEYFNIDPAFIRILAVLLALTKGIGLVAYIVCWIIIPRRPADLAVESAGEEMRFSNWHKYIPGIALIGLGVVMLIHEFWFFFSWSEIFPIVLIAAGILMLVSFGRRSERVDETTAQNDIHKENGGYSS